jgi:hypothetical protein
METKWTNIRDVGGGDKVLINGRPQTVWSVAHGARTVRVTYDVPGQTKADSRVTYQGYCAVQVVI